MAEATVKSKFLLRRLLTEFPPDGELPNLKYLETQIDHLINMSEFYRAQSRDPRLPARIRARARDLSQNAQGLINGIKFGISFWLHKDVDLADPEGKLN